MERVQQEFDPTEHPPEYLVVGLDEPLPSILERIEDAWMHTPNAVLLIPRGVHAFRTTHDFLALGKIQDSRQVRVSIATFDPIVAGLGRVLGFHMVDPPPDHPVFAGDPALSGRPEIGIEKPTAPLPLGVPEPLTGWVLASQAPSYPPASTTTSTWLNATGDLVPQQYLTGHLGSPRAAGRPGLPPPRTQPRQTGHLQPPLFVTADLLTELPAELPQVATPSGRLKARQALPEGQAYRNGRRFRYGVSLRPARLGRFFAVLALLLTLGLAAASTYAYIYLPEGTVSVTPLNTVKTDIPVEITVSTGPSASESSAPPAANGEQVQTAPSVAATLLSSALVEEGARPASGSRQLAVGRGQGTMRFTNRTGNPVTVPAGAQFRAANGVVVQTTQAGTVPPTNFSGQSFGTLDLPIAATVDGPGGNLAAGQLSGVYNGELNYTGGVMQGGGLETLKVVEQADIDTLVGELRAKAEARAASAVLASVASGQQLITQTITLANVRFEADRKAGEDASEVRVRLTADAQAYAYKETDLHDSVVEAVLDSVQTSIPQAVGPSLDLGSVRYTPPVVNSSAEGRIIYRTTASGRVTYSLTPELASQIRALVRGKKISQARNLIFENYGAYLNPDSVEARVLWFELDKLPSDPARIEVESSRVSTTLSPPPQDDTPAQPDPRSEP